MHAAGGPSATPGRVLVRVLGLGLGLVVAPLVSPLAGCAKDDIADRTARLDLNGTAVALDLESCGLDGETLFLVGRSSSGHVVQVVVALADDGTTGVVAGTGVSVDVDGRAYEAFGVDAWGRRGEAGEPPGEPGWARLRGSRIQVAGELDEAGEADGPPVPFTLDARCDDRDPDG